MEKNESHNDTIAAVATPPGSGAIGIIRISGPRAVAIASKIFAGNKDPESMPGFTAALGWIERQGERIDEVICLVMRAPLSYTCEDVVEFHCHGGPLTLAAVMEAVLAEGARPAQPGEFTRRAFLSGRIDLARAEAVADLVASQTDQAARAAAAQLGGALSGRLKELRSGLAEVLARLEAGIDFADEEDVEAIGREELVQRLDDLAGNLGALLELARRGMRYREGATVAIAGCANVGKSTLMNRLLGSERVIVTPEPGATRDVVEDGIEIEGMPIRLIDTAGIRAATGTAERIGVDMAKKAVARADLVLFLVDGSQPLSEQDREAAALVSGEAVLVINKCDLPLAADEEEAVALLPGSPLVKISALTGEGVERLLRAVAEKLIGEGPSEETPLAAGSRHAQALAGAIDAVERARRAGVDGLSPEFVASDLRRALDAVGEITGETAPEDLLDLIFSRFCIGK